MRKINKFILICLLLIAIGIGLLIMGFHLGGQIYGFYLNQHGFHIFAPSLQQENANTYIEENIELEAFDNIEADMEFCEIYLVAGDHYGISYHLNSQTALNYKVTNGTLKVSESYKSSSDNTMNVQWFSVGSMNNSLNSEEEYIEICVPQDAILKEINLLNDYGDIYFHALTAEDVSVESNYSKIGLESLTFSSLEIETQSGELQLADTTCNSLSVTSEYGNMQLSDINIKETANFSCSNGCLELDNTHFHSWILNTEYGDINGNTVSCDTASITTENSTCKLKEFTVNSIEAASEYGDITLQLTAPADTYNYNLRTEYGEITLDDLDVSNQTSFTTSSDSSNLIQINTKSGNIKISGS